MGTIAVTVAIRVAVSILLATCGAAIVFVTSVAAGAERVWPGVAYFFLANSASTFLILGWTAKR